MASIAVTVYQPHRSIWYEFGLKASQLRYVHILPKFMLPNEKPQTLRFDIRRKLGKRMCSSYATSVEWGIETTHIEREGNN